MGACIDEKDLARFQKLGIRNYIELVLLIPSGYENKVLYPSAHIGEFQLIDAEIRSFSPSLKFIKLRLFSHNFNQEIEGIIFRPKPYHQRQFVVGERMILFGKIELHFSHHQMIQPRIVNEAGKIVLV